MATRLGTNPEIRFLGELAGGSFSVEPVAAADWLRIAELVARYRDLPLGTVDASVVTAAERLGIKEIATVDRRHFTVVRPAPRRRVHAPPVNLISASSRLLPAPRRTARRVVVRSLRPS